MSGKISKAEFIEVLKSELAFQEAEYIHQTEFINSVRHRYEQNKKSGFVLYSYMDLITYWESNRKIVKNTIQEIKETMKKLSY
jgi:hypothetical protein